MSSNGNILEPEHTPAQSEDQSNQVFSELSPDKVIDAVESTGLLSDLRVFALNSYENLVYQVGL
jgi:Ser/Thr protein kinase RdoA (MazF antagonist)